MLISLEMWTCDSQVCGGHVMWSFWTQECEGNTEFIEVSKGMNLVCVFGHLL